MKTLTLPVPVQGAATYYDAIDKGIYMIDTDGQKVLIDKKKTQTAARKCAISWQKKENRAVLKSQGQI